MLQIEFLNGVQDLSKACLSVVSLDDPNRPAFADLAIEAKRRSKFAPVSDLAKKLRAVADRIECPDEEVIKTDLESLATQLESDYA